MTSEQSPATNTIRNPESGPTPATANATPPPQRVLGPGQIQLLGQIPKDAKIMITSVTGDAEALTLAEQIYLWMSTNGYAGVDTCQASFSTPIKGQHLNELGPKHFEILIGSRT